MPELKIDLETPNRFISSLSKSLQALCHGCMEFDCGIEIMGYININIDSGNKVDYVLNEKVMKSTTNSMTFVSNSFVAIKDQPKQTIDGSCSPIPELQPQSFQHTASSFPHHRTSFPHSSHSQVLQGARKRAWGGTERDWRSAPQKHQPQKHSRRGRPTYARVHDSHQPSEPQPSTHTHGASNFESNVNQTQVPVSHSGTDNVSVKKEIFPQEDNSEEDRLQNTEQFSESASASADGANVDVNIKSEPGSLPPNKLDTTNAPEGDSNTDSKSAVLGNFLEGGETSSVMEQSKNTIQAVDEFPSFGIEFPGGESVAHQEEGGVPMPDNSQASVQYDETHDDMSLPGTSFADEGEESRDESQFDVIEIGDDEEDQDMYQDAQNNYNGPRLQEDLKWEMSPRQYNEATNLDSFGSDLNMQIHCQQCSAVFTSLPHLGHHMAQMHGQAPHVCRLCGKGFLSTSGLSNHMFAHRGRTFTCRLCEKSFTQKHNLKAHMIRCSLKHGKFMNPID